MARSGQYHYNQSNCSLCGFTEEHSKDYIKKTFPHFCSKCWELFSKNIFRIRKTFIKYRKPSWFRVEFKMNGLERVLYEDYKETVDNRRRSIGKWSQIKETRNSVLKAVNKIYGVPDMPSIPPMPKNEDCKPILKPQIFAGISHKRI